MQRTIVLHGISVEYTLRVSARARHIRLAIHPGGRFVVSGPKRLSEKTVEAFVVQKADWILEKIELMKAKAVPKPVPMSAAEWRRVKVVALDLAYRRLEFFNEHYGFTYNNVTIRRQKTRWGSCSRDGNLNFNAKIIHLPPHLADYVIVHELCHVKEMNHSDRFWNLVAQVLPDHKERRREIRKCYNAI